MDVTLLSRIQFAVTIMFHYIFPPLSIGLGLILVIMEAMYLKTRKPLYRQMTRFWVRVFGLTFALGVASGIVMEFQFGTNWSNYSRFVGDVFGSILAAEGIFAFFLESGFLALLLFGWGRIGPKLHFFSTLMVCLGAHFSAVWIIIAGSWMQTPAGYHLVDRGDGLRAEIVSFSELVFNPSAMIRLQHTLLGAWQAGAFLVLSVSAFYLLRRRHEEFARMSMKVGLVVALIASVGSMLTGHTSAQVVAEYQPAKLAAMEGHWPASAPADMYVFGWVDEVKEETRGLRVPIPGMLGFLVKNDTKAAITGLRAFPPEDRPPVNIVFQSFHLMVALGVGMLGLTVLGLALLPGGRLFRSRPLLWMFVLAVLAPQLANQLGWMTAEVGRQPWIVYGILRTSEGGSPSVSASEVLTSLIMFSVIYLLLFVLFMYLLDRKIKHGPLDEDLTPERHRA